MKMRTFGLTLVILFVLVALCAPIKAYSAQDAIKIGYVDVARVFDNYDKTKEQDKALESQSNKKRDSRESMVTQIRKMKEEIEVLSEKAKEKKQADIDSKIKELNDYDRQANDELKEQRDNMVREILKDIDAVAEKYATDNGYTMLLNSRVLVYGQKTYDLTDKILQDLNAKYTKK